MACKTADKETCREYATQVTSNLGSVTNCNFDAGTNIETCTRTDSKALLKYGSKFDYVDEGQKIGRRLYQTFTVVGNGAGVSTYTYDSNKHLIEITSNSGISVSKTTPTALDLDGRPLFLRRNYDSGSGDTCNGSTQTLSYDDGGKMYSSTISYTTSTGTGIYAGTPCAGSPADSTTVFKFNEKNILVAAGNTTYTVQSVGKICYYDKDKGK